LVNAENLLVTGAFSPQQKICKLRAHLSGRRRGQPPAVLRNFSTAPGLQNARG
jgi:hypothetical protein